MKSRVFQKHPDLLTQMLLLRLEGWSRYALARKYDTDKTTIRHWCDRTFKITPVFEGTPPVRQITVITIAPAQPPKKEYKYQHIFDEEEVLPEPKSYDQIRVQARKRQLMRMGTL